jgi:hypothetical protein
VLSLLILSALCSSADDAALASRRDREHEDIPSSEEMEERKIEENFAPTWCRNLSKHKQNR